MTAPAQPTCIGRGSNGDHCCYLHGKVCEFLAVDTVPGRLFACGLRHDLGSWEAVNDDPRYRPVGEHWEKSGHPFNYCEVWQPASGICCREEN